MARYISIRGWLECDHQLVEKIRMIITNYAETRKGDNYETYKLYNQGWTFQNNIINWSSYIFYGADIKEYYLEFIRNEILCILELDEDIEGSFFIDYEEGERERWDIINKKIIEEII